ncbi:MAG: hypothetical protein JWR23_2 [Mucilaginibacter sp.]|nr:hypothetical protein [Mucilaginibacter sp.]
MKKYVIKMVTLLVFASVTITSCSLEYRQRRMHERDNDRGRDNDRNRDHDNNDHHYDNAHRY